MSTTKVKLWFVGKETANARLYSKLPESRNPEKSDAVWIPISQIEHVTKYPPVEHEWPVHIITIQDWLAEKHSL